MSLRIDGKKISSDIKEELKEQAKQLKEEGVSVCLAVIQVGNDPASSVYVNNKKKACAYIGIESQAYELPKETTQEELLALIDRIRMIMSMVFLCSCLSQLIWMKKKLSRQSLLQRMLMDFIHRV